MPLVHLKRIVLTCVILLSFFCFIVKKLLILRVTNTYIYILNSSIFSQCQCRAFPKSGVVLNPGVGVGWKSARHRRPGTYYNEYRFEKK